MWEIREGRKTRTRLLRGSMFLWKTSIVCFTKGSLLLVPEPKHKGLEHVILLGTHFQRRLKLHMVAICCRHDEKHIKTTCTLVKH